MNYDDYDFESILETIAPLYIAEGKENTHQFLLENKFPQELADELLKILEDIYRESSGDE